MAFCPKCGKEVGAAPSFCPYCGADLKVAPASAPMASPSASMSTPSPAQGHKSHRTRNIVIVIVALVIIVVVVASLASTVNSVQVTGVNLQIDYTSILTSGYFGPSSQSFSGFSANGGSQVIYTIVLSSNAILETHSVNSISLQTTGFTLVSVNPSFPISVSPGGEVSITLTIDVPSGSYNGPLGIYMTAS